MLFNAFHLLHVILTTHKPSVHQRLKNVFSVHRPSRDFYPTSGISKTRCSSAFALCFFSRLGENRSPPAPRPQNPANPHHHGIREVSLGVFPFISPNPCYHCIHAILNFQQSLRIPPNALHSLHFDFLYFFPHPKLRPTHFSSALLSPPNHFISVVPRLYISL